MQPKTDKFSYVDLQICSTKEECQTGSDNKYYVKTNGYGVKLNVDLYGGKSPKGERPKMPHTLNSVSTTPAKDNNKPASTYLNCRDLPGVNRQQQEALSQYFLFHPLVRCCERAHE